MSTAVTVEPGLSTAGPAVRVAIHGVQFFFSPAEAAALALDLVGACTIARYEAGLAAVLIDAGHTAAYVTGLHQAARRAMLAEDTPEVS